METILTIALSIFLYGLLWGILYFRGYKKRKSEVLACPEEYSHCTVTFYKNLSGTKAALLSFFMAIVVGLIILYSNAIFRALFR